MKKLMTFVLFAFALSILAGCESEEHHHHYGGYGAPPGPVVGHGYYQDGYYYDGYRHR
jgi:hypothetical protein